MSVIDGLGMGWAWVWKNARRTGALTLTSEEFPLWRIRTGDNAADIAILAVVDEWLSVSLPRLAAEPREPTTVTTNPVTFATQFPTHERY
uniref:hypothetical protein n=1 Tax=Haloarchaeobius sp. TZWSO28 TaxID=3446119 RepID=UPI003EBE89B5